MRQPFWSEEMVARFLALIVIFALVFSGALFLLNR